MKRKINYIVFTIVSLFSLISVCYAYEFDVQMTSNTVIVGNSVEIKIKASGLVGRFNLSSSDTSIATIDSDSSKWLEDEVATFKIITKKAGTVNFIITPSSVSTAGENPVDVSLNPIMKTLTVNNKPTSNPNTGGNSSGTSNTSTPVKKKSNNNYLSSLTVDGYSLDKEFKKDELEYSLVVESGTDKVIINAQLDDDKAKVTGIGEIALKEENNKLEIKVTAEDGSTRTYILNVKIEELNPVEVTIDKKKYSIVRKEIDSIKIPNGYEKSTIKIGDEDILCYKNDKTKNILMILQDDKGNNNLYSYNEKTKKYTLYSSLTLGNTTLSIIDMPSNLVPKGYTKVSFKYDDTKLEGYQYIESNKTYAADDGVKGSDFYLVYAINEKTGEKALYVFDKLEGTIQRFNSDLVKAYEDENNQYFLYMLISLALLAVSIIVLSVVLIKQKKNKNKFA